MDFAIPADPFVKIKEIKKINKYLDLACEPKKQEQKTNKTVEHQGAVMPSVVEILGRIPKELKK